MTDPKKNPLIGAFRAAVPGTLPGDQNPKPPSLSAAQVADQKAPEGKGGQMAPKEPMNTTVNAADKKKQEVSKMPIDKPAEEKKEAKVLKAPIGDQGQSTDGRRAGQETQKTPAGGPTKPAGDKKGPDASKSSADDQGKSSAKKKDSLEPAKALAEGTTESRKKRKLLEEQGAEKKESDKDPNLRFVALSKIKPLPGTYVKDEPRKDYSSLIADIQKNGLKNPVILRQSEKEGEFQLVDGFHRCKALEQANMLEVRADVYEMTLAQANEYRKGHREKPLMPIPGKLVPYPPEKPAKAEKAPDTPGEKPQEDELPQDLKIPLTKDGQPETVTTMKVANIRPFEGHPFAVRDDKDMWDLVDSIKKFGVLEPVMVIPHKDGGYEMVSGHRRMRACQLAGIETIPVIVRNLDRDEAIISMVDSNLKREEISPMEKARAYQMKTDAMKRKMGRRTKEEIAQDEAMGIKRMNADEELAQQVGESPATIQRYKTLNKLVPELQDMVDQGKIPVNTGADIAQMKPTEQKVLADAIQKEDKVPSGTKAKELKAESKAGKLTTEKIEQAVAPTKREDMPPLKVILLEEDLRPYFPDKRTTVPDAKQGIFEALKLRQMAKERQEQQSKAAAKKGARKPDEPAR